MSAAIERLPYLTLYPLDAEELRRWMTEEECAKYEMGVLHPRDIKSAGLRFGSADGRSPTHIEFVNLSKVVVGVREVNREGN